MEATQTDTDLAALADDDELDLDDEGNVVELPDGGEWVPVTCILTCPVCGGAGEVQPGRDPQVTVACRFCDQSGEVTFELYAFWAADQERPAVAPTTTAPVPGDDPF